MWFIIAFVIAAAFGNQPHPFGSVRHFDTQAECEAYIPTDADELAAELESNGVSGPYRITSHCEQDGEPA